MDREIPPWFDDSGPRGEGTDDAGAGHLLVALLVAALSMGFGAVLVFYLHSWARAEAWPPPGMPALPRGLWLSTAILLASGATMQTALRAARVGRWRRLRRAMGATLALGALFLVSQTVNWGVAVAAGMPTGLYTTGFYLLTGLHGAHVLGGLLPMAIVTRRAFRGEYSPARHAGVAWLAMYWHFLDAVWLVLFLLLVFL